jgi:hypothetical protein
MLAGVRIETVREASAAVEPFFYSFGLNPEYRSAVEERGLAISGTGSDGAPRALEVTELRSSSPLCMYLRRAAGRSVRARL